jgi:CRISPR-associated protein Csb2
VAARSITHLGWGIDLAIGDARIISTQEATQLVGERWNTSPVGLAFRTPRVGSLMDVMRKHNEALDRFTGDGARPVPPLRSFNVTTYRRVTDPAPRPHAVFRLLDDNGDTYRHPHAKIVRIAGMVRHLAIDAMKRNPPRQVRDPSTWIERYVAGHRDKADESVDLSHAQLSYAPLPSTGTPHTDPGVRRVMIVGPVGDEPIIEHLARQLDGTQLRPQKPEDLRGPVFLQFVKRDNIARFYTDDSRQWASFTPVILPGHDDHKPEKARKLIEKALAQSGIDMPCTFEWSGFSQFPKSYSAHKYDKAKRPAGYIRPDHLLNQTAVHLRLTFDDPVPGPLTIGAGRHCGFGLMAAGD